jgi:hypothetical protein
MELAPRKLSKDRCSHNQRVPNRRLSQKYETKTEPCPPNKSMKSWLMADPPIRDRVFGPGPDRHHAMQYGGDGAVGGLIQY